MFTRSGKGSKQGQMADLDRGIDRPILPPPVWVEELKQEMRAMGDIMRLREALAVAHRDLERMRIQRDRMIKQLSEEHAKVVELEQIVTNMLRSKP